MTNQILGCTRTARCSNSGSGHGCEMVRVKAFKKSKKLQTEKNWPEVGCTRTKIRLEWSVFLFFLFCLHWQDITFTRFRLTFVWTSKSHIQFALNWKWYLQYLVTCYLLVLVTCVYNCPFVQCSHVRRHTIIIHTNTFYKPLRSYYDDFCFVHCVSVNCSVYEFEKDPDFTCTSTDHFRRMPEKLINKKNGGSVDLFVFSNK